MTQIDWRMALLKCPTGLANSRLSVVGVDICDPVGMSDRDEVASPRDADDA